MSVSSTAQDASRQLIVKKYMLLSLAVGLVPLPVVDLAALTAVQLQMLSKLSKEYEIEFSEERVTALLGSLAGAGGGVLVSSASHHFVLRLIPVTGWLIAAVNVSVFAGASTYAVGKVFIQHFESGGTFLTFEPERVREYYSQQFKQGGVEVAKTFAGIRP